MFAKSLIAAAAIAATFAVAAPLQAEAKTNVDINIGFGIGGFYPGYAEPGYYPAYGYGYGYNRGHISCQKGGRIVDRSGFNRVRPVDCSLPGYRYTAWRHGHKFVVTVNRFGNITRVNRIF